MNGGMYGFVCYVKLYSSFHHTVFSLTMQTPVERVAFVFVRVCLWNLFVWMIAIEYCTGSGVRCTCVLLSLRSVGCVFV